MAASLAVPVLSYLVRCPGGASSVAVMYYAEARGKLPLHNPGNLAVVRDWLYDHASLVRCDQDGRWHIRPNAAAEVRARLAAAEVTS